MWKRLASWLKGATKEEAEPQAPKPIAPFDEAGTRAAVQTILDLDLGTNGARERHAERVLAALRLLDAEIEKIRGLANGYPRNPISGNVWFYGVAASGFACSLTAHFKAAGWLNSEQTASTLWAKATLAVNSHYHHLVGPAMLANADCNDRLGELERGTQLYSAVVRDFMVLIEEWLEEPHAPDEANQIALEAMKTAAERLLARGVSTVGDINLVEVCSRITEILSYSEASTSPTSD